MDLLLVRHGHTTYQDETGAFTPDGWLSPEGERQAARVATTLAAGPPITHLLSSPLVRALGTAAIVAAALGGPPVEVWMDLREGYDRPHRARGGVALRERFPAARFPAALAANGWDHGGEDYAAFVARCARLAGELVARFGPDDRVVAVTHGGCANYLLHAILGIPTAAPQWFELGYCSLSEIRFVPEDRRREGFSLYPPVTAEILRLNDQAHLAAR